MKKLISLLLVCVLCMSMMIVVNAEEKTYGKFTIEAKKYDANDYNPYGYVEVKVYAEDIENFVLDDLVQEPIPEGTFVGYDAIGLSLRYNNEAFRGGYDKKSVGKVTTVYGEAKSEWPILNAEFPFEASGANFAVTKVEAPAYNSLIGAYEMKYGQNVSGVLAGSTGIDYDTETFPELGKVRVATFYLQIQEGATGTETLTLADVELANVTAGYTHKNFELGTAEVVISEEPIDPPTPEVPEVSTVKTFPKLKWDATTGSLTTVGVVTIGKDIEGMKYGINIVKGEGTVNYWTDKTVLTTSGAEAYYAIQLDGITETTDITVNSASKAVLSNGATGEAVTYVAE